MSRSQARELVVQQTTQLTPNMRRVTLGGAGMANFPDDQESAYIKLLFPQGVEEKPLMRTYTVSRQRTGEIDVDFALHNHPGPASRWAVDAQPGDRIRVGGPGPRKLVNREADWFLLAGDMTALPALSVNLTELPRDANGYLIVEVSERDDIQPLKLPTGFEVHWLVQAEGETLAEKVKQLPWLPGQVAVWVACEFSNMRALRQYFKKERALPRSHLYISSYWKSGQSEDEHKRVKREDALAEGD